MGIQDEINDRVTYELRRDSVIIYVEGSEPIEWDYNDVEAVNAALFKTMKSDRYLDYRGKQLVALPDPKETK